MLRTPDVYLLFCLVGATHALYKQWIPDTNYENKTNWNTGVVPCGRDRVVFPARGSVYVETAHSVKEMILPINGGFILNSGAGFYIGGAQEPGCGTGANAQFKDSDSLQWFNPALWQAAVALDDLKNGQYLFSVHEDSVPCEHDDVIFKASTSFRVDTTSNNDTVPVKSVSVLGKTFNRQSDLSQYLGTALGRTQFHGESTVTVKASGCPDPSGCACGNSANQDRICASVACPSLTCKKPLRPAGHCCDVCGAIITLQYTLDFNLQSYRQRVQRLLDLAQPSKTIQFGMSKFSKPQYFMGTVRVGAHDDIQIVLLDGETGLQSGTVAEALARVILEDVRSHGSSLGISGAEVQASSARESNAGVVVGAIFGVLILAALIGAGVFLVRKGHVPMPSISMPAMPSLSSWKKKGEMGDLGGPVDHGYDNPMFDKPSLMPAVPSIYGSDINSISMTSSGVHFVNPVYDDHETDFTI